MAVYQFSALSDGQAISFDPDADVLNFDQASIAAADVRALAEGSNLRMSAFGKDVVLLNVTALQLATTNITFADGSRLLFGDNTTGQSADNSGNSLLGTGGADHLWGLGGNDTLNGGAGDDWLVGGTGQDNLTGGTGADSFVFVDTPFNTNYDRVFGFVSGSDRVFLHEAAYAEAGALGQFSAGDPRFYAAPGAAGGHDADDRIIYNSSNGNLFYDADGSGPGREMFIGVLHGAPLLAATDITLFDDTAAPPPDPEPGTATNGDDTLVGTAGNDTIDGLAGNDSISGLGGNDSLIGGPGADTLDGGAGDDTFVVDASDVLIDTAGIDTVVSEVAWTLGDAFENLTLTGSGAVNAIGNNLANRLVGNDAANGFSGRAGDDTLIGNGGDDIFVMSAGGAPSYGDDFIDGGAGVDTLDFGAHGTSALVVDLAAGSASGGDDSGAGRATLVSIENVNGGALADVLTGNDAANFLFGYLGDDTLDGGAGNDRLEGDAGADRYVFSAAPGGANADIVVGFVSGSDAISLDRGQFTNVGAGDFTAGDARFSAGPGFGGGQDPSDRIIYNTSNGNLYYDGDGSGPGAALLFATLEGAPALTATDIDMEGASPGGQVINGTAGNDSLVGGSGSDTINGFAGDDTLTGGPGNDVLRGGDGRDVFVLDQPAGPADADDIQGYEGGSDDIVLDAAVMPALGPSGRFSALDVRYHAAAGATSGADADDRIVYDTTGGNLYYDADGSGAVAAQLIAWIQPGPFAPRFVPADDLVVVNGSASGLVINGTSGNDSQTGTAGADTMNGFGGNDTLFGNEGNDRVDGGEGNDELHGNEGDDLLLGGPGNDSLSGEAGNDTMLGGDGDDVFWLGFFGGHDSIDGGAGIDVLDFSRFSQQSAATVDLAAGTSSGGGVGGSGSATLASIENVTGTHLDDRITGNAGINVLAGSFGNDTIDGGAGDDVVDGASGNDVLSGGDGNDALSGGEGNDSLQGGLGADLLQGGEGVDTLDGGAGADALVFDTPPSGGVDLVIGFASGIDQLRFDGAVFTRIGASGAFSAADGRFHAAPGATAGHDPDDRIVYDSASGDLYYDADGNGADAAQLVARLQGAPALAASDIAVVNGSVAGGGTSGDDSLVGSPADDTLDGGDGNDTLDGLAGNDRLIGGQGNDSLIGNEGADVMLGGDGNDTLDGAAGADEWWFGGEATFDPQTGEPLPGDTMDGGLGDDVYYVQWNDFVSDAGGIDTIHTDQTTYTLGAGFENLDYMPFGFSDGEGYFITYSGNELDNQITVRNLWHSSTSVLDGGDGNDTLEDSGRAVFQFSLGSGDYGHDELRADGAFTGTIDFADARSGIVANLAAGTLAGGGTGGTGSATFVGIDNVIGGDFADHLVAHPTGDDHFDNAYLRGGGGDDTLEGAEGNRYYLYGDDGADRLVAHSGIDLMTGGAGADDFVLSLPSSGEGALIFDFASAADEVVLDASSMPALGPSGQFAPNDARFYAAPGATAGHDADDRVVYNTSTSELFYDADGSGAGAARLIATLQAGATLVATDIAVENGSAPPPGGQTITGTAGNDSLAGGTGNDTIVGLGGNDTLNGAGGDDWLEGGPGQDNLTGGDGADSFVFRDTPFNNNYDRVFGFASGTDELVFDRDAYTNIGAPGDFAAGDGRFYAAAGAVRGHDADDRIIYNTSNGTLYYDADGSGSGREMYIGVLHGAPALDATDIAVI